METLRSKLRAILETHPESKSLQNAIRHLFQNVETNSQSHRLTWEIVKHDFDELMAEGVWVATPQNVELLQELRQSLADNPTGSGSLLFSQIENGVALAPNENAARKEQDIQIVLPPLLSMPLLSTISLPQSALLPQELLDHLNHAYFVHVMATEPQRLLPPGKSLLSAMLRPHLANRERDGLLPTLHDRVEDLVHRAFWDEAFESLSNALPSIQLPRIANLYEDLYIALKQLLPSHHPILVTLSSPLPPSSFPLRSVIINLREILICLRGRCAPARDGDVDTLMARIDEQESTTAVGELARLVVDTTRSILKLSEIMKDDLSEFVLGSMDETQLRAIIVTQAQKFEIKFVLELWGSERTRKLWEHWREGLQPLWSSSPTPTPSQRAWVIRLIQSLGSTTPVSCSLPTVCIDSTESRSNLEFETISSNILPPPLLFICPTLLYLQNYFQALIIAASLRSLVRLPGAMHTRHQAPEDPEDASFMARIWTLLLAEVNEEPGAGETKVVNLADEVIRVRRRSDGDGQMLDPDEETKLRAAVDRTLKPHDPVFLLLQKRLLKAIAGRLAHRSGERDQQSNISRVPDRLETGREGQGKRQRFVGDFEALAGDRRAEAAKEPSLIIEGFNDEVLVHAISVGLTKLRHCIEWTEQTWVDLT
ncbi:uncharacterized protein FIBRA_07200 [Fibroporia radiculosa]|uniref:Uncharacterized protein n=1 Tax=Fibroporia radiculosa TaxID=599839 RepID=J4IBP1_9APHY|nr:uncharacterized protein FIBRA_07200 [Fibroporia radiculosa]CCM05001.1 predicted protein [Fibroporia radiculosa]